MGEEYSDIAPLQYNWRRPRGRMAENVHLQMHCAKDLTLTSSNAELKNCCMNKVNVKGRQSHNLTLYTAEGEMGVALLQTHVAWILLGKDELSCYL